MVSTESEQPGGGVSRLEITSRTSHTLFRATFLIHRGEFESPPPHYRLKTAGVLDGVAVFFNWRFSSIFITLIPLSAISKKFK